VDEPLDPLLALEEQEAAPDAAGEIRSGRLAGKSIGVGSFVGWFIAIAMSGPPDSPSPSASSGASWSRG